ncbi:dTDP-glucose 4,6-dehydratase [Pontibacillus salicampi]|uniref:dTDP-glucose 4,6-dehydratase n=1 Tax=Pontibacillus salicampi TaxID=1449801 RepID=A0ABV6LQ59_9BACI
MKNRLLVTGGAGFIGSNFISYMLEHTDYYITNIDSLTYASNRHILDEFQPNPRYTFMKGDISKPEDIAAVTKDSYEWVINFAAESHVDRSIEDALPFLQSNIMGTYQLLEAVRKGAISNMIQISTDEVYGSLAWSDDAFTEQTPIAPNNPYSASKASADLLVSSYVNTHQAPVIISRCSNNFGPMQNKEKFIPTIILNAMKDERIPLYGAGTNMRDWLYVEDHCRAIFNIMKNGEMGEVYNIGGNEELTNYDVLNLILKKLGKDESLIKYVDDRKGHDLRYAMNYSKVLHTLGWKPSVSFEEGIEKTIAWYTSQKR